jgi:hypothetical protein
VDVRVRSFNREGYFEPARVVSSAGTPPPRASSSKEAPVAEVPKTPLLAPSALLAPSSVKAMISTESSRPDSTPPKVSLSVQELFAAAKQAQASGAVVGSGDMAESARRIAAESATPASKGKKNKKGSAEPVTTGKKGKKPKADVAPPVMGKNKVGRDSPVAGKKPQGKKGGKSPPQGATLTGGVGNVAYAWSAFQEAPDALFLPLPSAADSGAPAPREETPLDEFGVGAVTISGVPAAKPLRLGARKQGSVPAPVRKADTPPPSASSLEEASQHLRSLLNIA